MSGNRLTQDLQRSDNGRRVVTLRERLLRAGVTVAYLAPADVNDPSVFDDHVDAAVRAFQQSRGLLVDGMVGPETDRSLAEAQYRFGDRTLGYSLSEPPARGDDVAELQQQLSHLGFYYGHLDGEFGPRTRMAVTELQQNVGLVPDGICDNSVTVAMARISRSISPSSAFSLRDYERLAQASAALHGRVIALAPARGLHCGTTRTGEVLTEQKVTTDIARRIAATLEQFGAHIVLSADRADDAAGTGAIGDTGDAGGSDSAGIDSWLTTIEAHGAGLNISLHCDWLEHSAASGVSAFYWGVPERNETRSPIGERAASLVHRELVARTGMVDLGVHPRSWAVLRASRTPSVRLELGYLSNDYDVDLLSDRVMRQVMADAIVIAIQRLYLVDEEDHPTGTMNVDDVSRLNPSDGSRRITS